MPVSMERMKEVLDYNPDSGDFVWTKTLSPRAVKGSKAGCVGARGRMEIRIDGELHLAHRLAWLYMTGECPNIIDHADGNPSNNSFINLRKARQAENCWNSKKRTDNTSGFKGVRLDKARGKWSARLRVNGEFVLLKRFNSREEAVAAHRMAVEKHHGEFARVH